MNNFFKLELRVVFVGDEAAREMDTERERAQRIADGMATDFVQDAGVKACIVRIQMPSGKIISSRRNEADRKNDDTAQSERPRKSVRHAKE